MLKNVSRVRPPFELFYDEFKLTRGNKGNKGNKG